MQNLMPDCQQMDKTCTMLLAPNGTIYIFVWLNMPNLQKVVYMKLYTVIKFHLSEIKGL